MKKNLIWLGVFASIIVNVSAESTSFTATPSYDTDLSFDSAFQQGKWEFSVNGGILFSPFFNAVTHRTVNYTTSGIQAGYMLSDPIGSGWLRGNYELVAEGFGGPVVDGVGSYVAGGTLWLRYNFLPANRLKPYAQIGGGAETTDIDRQILGQDVNFNLDLALGVRCFITPRCSVNLEYRYQHFSDAGMTKVNIGINAHGPVVGLSWYF